MKVLICVWHPKDVNTLKNVIELLNKKGHEVKIVAALKENTTSILDAYNFEYETLKHFDTIFYKAIGLLKLDFDLYTISKKFSPDVLVGGSPYAAHVGKLLGKPHICLSDTERATLALFLSLPFSDILCTPLCFSKNFGDKQISFDGYFELAYLHPNYFSPNPSILEKFGLSRDERFVLLKFSSLNSSHDLGVKGFNFKTNNEILEFITKLEVYGRVLVFSEVKLTSKLEKYKIDIPLTEFHNLMSFATMYIGEGATMAAEAAVLGVPSIYVSTTRRGYLDELETKYDLAYTVSNKKKALEKSIFLLKDKDIKTKFQIKRELMLNEKIDPTEFMIDIIEKCGSKVY